MNTHKPGPFCRDISVLYQHRKKFIELCGFTFVIVVYQVV